MRKTAAENVWNMYACISDDAGNLQNVISPAGGAGGVNPFFELTFGTDGLLTGTNPAALTIDNWNPQGSNQSSANGSTAVASDFPG